MRSSVWGHAPLSPAERRRRRILGLAVIALVLGSMLSLHLFRRYGTDRPILSEAFEHLVQATASQGTDRAAALTAAETSFRRGIGSMWVDPLALIGLSMVDAMATQLGQPMPPEPAHDQRGDRIALAHGKMLLERGHLVAALKWLGRARVRYPTSEPLQQLQLFAELWASAHLQAKGPAAKPATTTFGARP